MVLLTAQSPPLVLLTTPALPRSLRPTQQPINETQSATDRRGNLAYYTVVSVGRLGGFGRGLIRVMRLMVGRLGA